MQRHRQNRFKTAKRFNKSVSRTRRINIRPLAQRAGYRL